MRILVVGASGQVGRELLKQGRALGYQVIATHLADLDICNDAQVRQFLTNARPDVIFNAAAWTAVDDAESFEANAFRVNRDGARNLAAASSMLNVPLVHYSTDYVFDGTKASAYVEDDAPNPLNAYGRSKLAGEASIQETLEKHLIVRTSSVFSPYGRNFVSTMLNLGAVQKELRVVADQVGKPTSAAKLAEYSLAMLAKKNVAWGTYHIAQPEPVSWFDFANDIFKAAERHKLKLAVKKVIPIAAFDFNSTAKRPANSALDCQKYEITFGIAIDDWHEALDHAIEEYMSGGILA